MRGLEGMAFDEGGGGLGERLLGFFLLTAGVHEVGGAGDYLHIFRVEQDKLLEQAQSFLGLALAGVDLGGLDSAERAWLTSPCLR